MKERYLEKGYNIIKNSARVSDPAAVEEIEKLAREWYQNEIIDKGKTSDDLVKISKEHPFYALLCDSKADSIVEFNNGSWSRDLYNDLLAANTSIDYIDVDWMEIVTYEQMYFQIFILHAIEIGLDPSPIMSGVEVVFGFILEVCDKYSQILDEMFKGYHMAMCLITDHWCEGYRIPNAKDDEYAVQALLGATMYLDFALISGIAGNILGIIQMIQRLKYMSPYIEMTDWGATIVRDCASELKSYYNMGSVNSMAFGIDINFEKGPTYLALDIYLIPQKA